MPLVEQRIRRRGMRRGTGYFVEPVERRNLGALRRGNINGENYPQEEEGKVMIVVYSIG